jgi:hypothetical protein
MISSHCWFWRNYIFGALLLIQYLLSRKNDFGSCSSFWAHWSRGSWFLDNTLHLQRIVKVYFWNIAGVLESIFTKGFTFRILSLVKRVFRWHQILRNVSSNQRISFKIPRIILSFVKALVLLEVFQFLNLVWYVEIIVLSRSLSDLSGASWDIICVYWFNSLVIFFNFINWKKVKKNLLPLFNQLATVMSSATI